MDFPIPIPEGLDIQFDSADIDFKLTNTTATISWLKSVIDAENGSVAALNYIFCSDDYLHKLNVQYLDHDTFTDIITFPISDNPIQSDLFLSIDRIKDNSKVRVIDFENELHRVIVHGLLHLLGYEDKTSEQQVIMRQKENHYLALFNFAS